MAPRPFVALNVLDGTVIGRNMSAIVIEEFIRFLSAVEAEVPTGKVVHVILETDAAHQHPRFVPGSIGTSASSSISPDLVLLANAVEGFFASSLKRRLKRGVFRSVVDLEATINRFVADTMSTPSPSDGPPTQT